MNSALFLLVATLPITQCPQDGYGPVFYGPPIVCAPADYNHIHFTGDVYSKKYVTAAMDDGQRMTIPVINGILPTVNYKRLASGGMQRDFWYDEGFKYGGEAVVEYYSEDLPLSKKAGVREESSFEEAPPRANIRPPKARVREDEELPPKKSQMPDPKIQQLQDAIGELQKTVVELRETVKRQQAQVVPEPKVDALSPMKKPSEFDKEPK